MRWGTVTVSDVLCLVKALRPTHELDEQTQTALLLELEQQLALEVRAEQGGVPSLRCGELAVPAPFGRVYWAYLLAMAALASGDRQGYLDAMTLHRESREAYARWHQRTVGQKN